MVNTNGATTTKLLKKFNQKEIYGKVTFYYITIFCAA